MTTIQAHYKAIYAMREKLHSEAAKAQVNKPPIVPPIVDQVRDYLATLPPAQKQRISLPAILPHLKGRYREVPNHVHVARALRVLGFKRVRSYSGGDEGCRLWVAPEIN